MPQISIIILTYNSSRFIEDLLKSLQDFAKDCEIIIVDNDSKDDTVKLARKSEHVNVFQTGKNLGFAKGINFGAEKAKGKYLLFINPDAVFKSGQLSDLVKVFQEKGKAGVIGGKLVGYDGVPEKSAGKFFNLFESIMIILGLDERVGVRFSPDKLSKVDFVSGGFMMVRSDIFKKIGGFDENFFMYVEDMELCYRVKKIGYETYFSSNVVVSHKGQGSSNRAFAVVNIYKGILYFYKKHKSNFEYNMIKFLLWGKAKCIYILGSLTNNDYYKDTYAKALDVIK